MNIKRKILSGATITFCALALTKTKQQAKARKKEKCVFCMSII